MASASNFGSNIFNVFLKDFGIRNVASGKSGIQLLLRDFSYF